MESNVTYRIRSADGREYGPVDLATLQRWVREARVNASTVVWSSADPVWRPARERRELDEVFAELRASNAPPVIGPLVNPMAIWSFVLAQLGMCCCVPAIPAIICGMVSLSQIRERGERGRVLAISGITLGVLGVVLNILVAILFGMAPMLNADQLQKILDELLKQLQRG